MIAYEEWRELAQATANARLAVYDQERRMRMIGYAVTWERKWAEAKRKASESEARTRRDRFSRVG